MLIKFHIKMKKKLLYFSCVTRKNSLGMRKTDDFVITVCDELKNTVKTPQAFEQHIFVFSFACVYD